MIEVHLMDIIWHGHSCFELVSGGYSAVIDPFQDTSVGTAYPHVRLTADAVYISHEDRDHNFREGVTLRSTGKANPFAVTELETYHDIMRGRLRGMNTVRIFAAEGMRVAHLGDLGAKPTPEQMQQLQGLDAMMIPVGGIYTIEPDTAYYLCEQLQPRVIIPMHFQAPGHSNHRLRAPEDFTGIFEGNGANIQRYDANRMTLTPDTPARSSSSAARNNIRHGKAAAPHQGAAAVFSAIISECPSAHAYHGLW